MSQDSPLRVAVVDDSTFIRKAITRMLDDHPRIDVVGSASSGEALITHLDEWRPDVVTLDLDMPGMGGLATLDRLATLRPTPVIILSTHSGEGAPLTIEALHRGATDFIDKQQYSLVDFDALRTVLLDKIFQVTGVRDPAAEAPTDEKAKNVETSGTATDRPTLNERGDYDLIVIGASTGGPPVLQTILEQLRGGLPIPVVVVQHMPAGFTLAFAERLNAHLGLPVCEARHGDPLLAGTVYIAPAGRHLRVGHVEGSLTARLSKHPREAAHAPSVDVLFESAARSVGPRAVAVLLTGMGTDGARGMAALRRRGAHTMCQDEASSIVFGMPRAALRLDAVLEVASPKALGARLQALAQP